MREEGAPAAGTPAIDVRGLVKRFGSKTVVDDVSIRVETGEIYGFLGPNGSGKTTTIRLLCGLLTPDAGEGTCLGLDIRRQSAAIKRQVGYMTQKFSFWEDLSIAENLDFVARMYGLPDRRRRVMEALDRLGLSNRRTQLAGELSGGWKQRLALAACILHEPKLLLLDEPTAGVDPKARREFWDEIHRLAGEGLTVLVSTHYMDEAERCHRIAYIAYGTLMTSGTVDQVIAESGLHTRLVAGSGLHRIAAALEGQPGVEMVAVFGSRLHVSGIDAAALDRALAPWTAQPGTGQPPLRITATEPTLEDVFIHLMNRSTDNFR
ncbi:multidrug ABC transporter ATP-binding protein [Azospirillum sp. TSH7]|uniref:ABC transporter ATP-binding protein n=1 Tax=unclassified Azospirillum TaxID=2630922 RepID=UPI000D609D6B|nr:MULTISPECIES: ABC transporter ATP-binding protein [unclassified Azospirillum]PWC53053.1 multidrug ABC transporter ATP-binding protein [Azospirillum sp. TSH7]PWC56271.1 multidrug ABC transporter ATP-binding protein [Azospirillum sp. TSH20]